LLALVGALAIACVAGAVVVWSVGTGPQPGTAHSIPTATGSVPTRPPAHPGRPNIVFVLTDDLSLDLVRYMPHVVAMERDGLRFKNYFVSDSLCCPSRASIFTGDFPHDTGIFSNFGADGGFHAFYARGEDQRTFALALQRSGYETAMMGKFLNGYLQAPGHGADGSTSNVPGTYVPPGWSDWAVAGWGYPEFNYTLNENGVLYRYGHRPSDYLTDVIARRGVDFIDQASRSGKPFFLELATFAPHFPYTPAPRDARRFPGLRAPRPPSFDVLPTHPPHWLAGHQRLTRAQMRGIDSAFRRRAQSVQAVDAMIATVEQTLSGLGIADNTYLVFSSDNGLHMGEYRLLPGKLTAFDTDIHVPLVVDGPGVAPGTATSALTENVDLAKTFTAIGGTTLASDGHTLMPLLHGHHAPNWRDAVLVEHHGARQPLDDPDFQPPTSGNPTTYEAMRTDRFLYVEYADGEREFYNLRRDPFELHNLAGRLTRSDLALLHKELSAMKHCHGGRQCWAAMHVNDARPS
jgi:N-acetylglucosamine-6-sulfatase